MSLPCSVPAVRRTGFTLFELLIAVGLTSLLMAALYSAMSTYFELQLDSHEEIARQQVARAVLRQMTRDIQSVVFAKQEVLPEDEEGSTGGSGSSGSGTSGLSGGGTSGLSGSGTSGLSSGTTGSGAGTATSGGSSASSGGMSTSGELDGNAYGESMIDPETVSTTYTSGLVGTATDLQLFVSRPDPNLAYVSSQELSTLDQRTGDLVIIRYLMADKQGSGLGSEIADREAPGRDEGPVGLARMAGDLYGLSTAVENSEDSPQLAAAKLLAREVSGVQFRYFDGIAWQEEWDSTALNSLPKAIEIVLTVRDEAEASNASFLDEPDPYALPATIHRVVVPLPVAEPIIAEQVL
jgi:prepilin-type N-terminal cleavage/methylation domain-containing protein